MSLHHLGQTRGRRAPDHLLQTPDTFVWSPLPGMAGATACIHAAPAMGAGFVQYTAVLEEGGTLAPPVGSRFIFVLEGVVHLQAGDRSAAMGVGGYAYLPPGCVHTVVAEIGGSRVAVLEKPYAPLPEASAPDLLIGSEGSIQPVPLNGDDGVRVRALLPLDDARFDFAINIMEYQPGASLSMVEVHVMEHGLLMLDGGGIYRLGDSWYPVIAGDFIWMGAFCPQWFGALGKVPARYLIYKDWNRHPLGTSETR